MSRWRHYARKKLESDGGMLPWVTLPLSLGYETVMRLRNRRYERTVSLRRRLPVPVVSVGNITLGGTGKTPAVIMIARLLQARGYRPAVISRGYGGQPSGEGTIVSDGARVMSSAEAAGDEPVMMAQALAGVPVVTGTRRYEAGRVALERFDVDVVIMDDGFQHRRLERDVDLLLLDGHRPFGNGRIFPAGTLREPVGSIRRAHMILATDGKNAPDMADIRRIAPAAPLFPARRRPVAVMDGDGKQHSLSILRSRRVVAFAGIAVPERFRETLEPLCGEIAAFFPFPDHHCYGGDDIRLIKAAAAACSADAIVTTEKDEVRLRRFPDVYRFLMLLRIEMAVLPSPDAMMDLLCGKLHR